VFVLSHGQSDVERGYSVNKEMLVENLEKSSLITQRLIYDAINADKIKLETMKLSPELMKNCELASSRYKAALRESNALKEKNEVSRKRKLAADDIAELKRKKLCEEECIQNLNQQVEEKSLEAEEKQDFTLLAEANSFRATQKTKTEKVKKLSEMIEKMEKELKGMK